MATYTAERDDHLAELETRVVGYAKTMLVDDAQPILSVVEYLRAETILTPGLGLKRYECQGPSCHLLTDTPIRDDIAVSWIGDQAAAFCSKGCLANAAEAYWEGVALSQWSA